MSLLSISRRNRPCSGQRRSGQRRFGKALVVWLLLLGAVVSLGCAFFILVPAGRHLAALPITPLGELAQHAGTGKIVRVQARLVSDPPVIDLEGQSLALQRLQVSIVSSDQEAETAEPETVEEIAYDETVPGLLWASDGEGAVAVDPVDFDPGFVHEAASAQAEDDEIVPSAIRVKLSPEFDDVPTPAGAMMRLWHIEQGADVTIIGEVRLEGDPVLQAPEGGHMFIISPLSMEEIVERADAQSVGLQTLRWVLIALGTLMIAAALANARRRKDRTSLRVE